MASDNYRRWRFVHVIEQLVQFEFFEQLEQQLLQLVKFFEQLQQFIQFEFLKLHRKLRLYRDESPGHDDHGDCYGDVQSNRSRFINGPSSRCRGRGRRRK